MHLFKIFLEMVMSDARKNSVGFRAIITNLWFADDSDAVAEEIQGLDNASISENQIRKILML